MRHNLTHLMAVTMTMKIREHPLRAPQETFHLNDEEIWPEKQKIKYMNKGNNIWRVTPETFDLWDTCSEWWGDIYWPTMTKTNMIKRKRTHTLRSIEGPKRMIWMRPGTLCGSVLYASRPMSTVPEAERGPKNSNFHILAISLPKTASGQSSAEHKSYMRYRGL